MLAWLQAKLVRSAIEDALAAVKRAHPLELLSLFEQRMRCLRYMGKCAMTAAASQECNAHEHLADSVHLNVDELYSQGRG